MGKYLDIILVGFGLAIILILVKVVFGKKNSSSDLMMLQNQVFDLQKQIKDSLSENSGRLDERLDSMARAISDSQKSINERFDGTLMGVNRTLGKLDESTKNVMDVGKDISKLSQLLRAPKFRGGMGEAFLEQLLIQVIPANHFKIGYTFKSGEKVDAIVRIGEMIVPIDSKFPLENFKRVIESTTDEERTQNRRSFSRDVKKHIDAIAAKYILPDEGTCDFALMYIPAENIYYEIASASDDINDHAREKRVIPVSPNTFYVYLQSIMIGFRGFQIEQGAKEIMANLSRLKGDMTRFAEDFETMGRHIVNAKSKYDDADKKLSRLKDKIEISSLSGAETPEKLKEKSHLYDLEG